MTASIPKKTVWNSAHFGLEPFFKWQADRQANDEENEKN